MSEQGWVFRASEVRASAIYTGESRLVRVRVRGSCPSAGCELSLTLANPGVEPHPRSLWLTLRVVAPSADVPRPAALREAEAIVEDERATEVVVLLPSGDAVSMPVHEPAGARRVRLAVPAE